MQELQDKIKALNKVSGKLEPSQDQRQGLITEAHSFADSFLAKVASMPTYSGASVDRDMSIKAEAIPLSQLLDLFKTEVTEKGIQPASAGHLGYIPGGGLYASALADYLVGVTNEYAGVHFASPGAVAIEHAVLDWLKAVFSFPTSAVGNLTSGGSIANLIALTAARDKYGIKNELIPKSVIYLSEQVHHCIQKALRIIGLEDVIIREIPLDEEFRLQPQVIAEAIAADRAAGLNPFMVIASAGTTDTGVVDPLKALGELCQAEGLWYHIDAAYGGFFILLEQTKALFDGIALADSLVVDPHKGLFIPYGVGAVLVKDKAAVMHSNHYTANYMQDTISDAHPLNPADVSPELSKHFRGLRVWLPLQLYGLEVFKACLEEKLLLTHYMRQKLTDLGFEIGPEPDLSVSYFWYPHPTDPNGFNQRLMDALMADGDVFLSSTRLNGRFVIRIALLSFRTKLETVDRAVRMIERCLRNVEFGNVE
ncbi:MAG: aminotransferase class V-fold PLP-dependent enzyme [Roseivirga sp.]|nr:aminotransferase class V-fold PLP-dependent enzyme [Roseivirga sp.]